MDIGKRNHLLTIERVETTDDGTGKPSEDWNEVATVWANKKPLNQRRALENGVDNLEGTAVFTFPYYDYPDLQKTDRIIEDKTYTIHSIVQNEKVDFTVIAKSKS